MSQYPSWPVTRPPPITFGSFGLYTAQHSGECGSSSASGVLGTFTSQMKLESGLFSPDWNSRSE